MDTMRFGLALLTLVGACAPQQDAPADTDTIRHFRLPSACLTDFWGKPVSVEAGVVLPPDHKRDEGLPVCYSVHGFGGSYRSAWRRGPELVQGMADGSYPRMIYVYLQAHFELGHHVFADSANNGPWGKALTEEFIPALEAEFGACAEPRGRFLTGHSSGGWSSLWLQVTYPDFFGGTWSTAPDSVDFRDFTGIDVYTYDNAFVDPDGEPIQLVRRGGKWVRTLQEFVEREASTGRADGQFASFDAVFSPRGEDGRPRKLFDWKTGAIDRAVAETWKKYDISLLLEQRWDQLVPKLAGKVRVYMGTQDTFRLEGALYRMRDRLQDVDGKPEIVFAEGRDHGTLLRSHELWPDGLLPHIHRAMRARFDG